MKHEDNITAGHKASFLGYVWNISIAIKLLKIKKLKMYSNSQNHRYYFKSISVFYFKRPSNKTT